MDFIISLAHFCETHGPTSIMCTQALPTECATCGQTPPPVNFDHPADAETSGSSSPGTRFCESGPGQSLNNPRNTILGELSSSHERTTTSHNPYFPLYPADGEMYLQPETTNDLESEACSSCALRVPGQGFDVEATSTSTNPASGIHGRKSLTLRTKESILACWAGRQADDADNVADHDHAAVLSELQHMGALAEKATLASLRGETITKSSSNTLLHQEFNAHAHQVTFLTSHHPALAWAYSLVRRACLRVLSCENLPRGVPSGALWFGDDVAGYTIAYIFRLPDPSARGKRRTYAFLALGGRSQWRAAKARHFILHHFSLMANRIARMADDVLEQDSGFHSPSFSHVKSRSVQSPQSADEIDISGDRDSKQPASHIIAARHVTPVSSFLSAKKVDPDGYPRGSIQVSHAKSLAEIVGIDRFFVDLHAEFVHLFLGLFLQLGA